MTTIHSVNGAEVKIRLGHGFVSITVGSSTPTSVKVDELFAALVVATRQTPSCTDTGFVLFNADSHQLDAAQRLLDDRYPPPDQWETVPVTEIKPGDEVRDDDGRVVLVTGTTATHKMDGLGPSWTLEYDGGPDGSMWQRWTEPPPVERKVRP